MSEMSPSSGPEIHSTPREITDPVSPETGGEGALLLPTTGEALVGESPPIHESYPALIGLRKIVLGAREAWKTRARDATLTRDTVSQDSAYMASANSSLQPHKVPDRMRPATFTEKGVNRLRESQTRKMRDKFYEQRRLAFPYGDGFAKPERLQQVDESRIPSREKAEIHRAAERYNKLGGGILGVEKRRTRLERAANGETRLSNRRERKFNRLDDQANELEQRLQRLEQQAAQKEVQKRLDKEALRQRRQERKTATKKRVVSTAKSTGANINKGRKAVGRGVKASGKVAGRALQTGKARSENWAQERWTRRVESRKP